MLKDLSEDEQKLAELMSWISEAGYCAGWMSTLELDLWEIIIGVDRRYGTYDLAHYDIDQLNSLSKKCGCWIIFDDVNEETSIDLETWKKMYLDKIIADKIIRQLSEFTPFGDDDLENDNVHYLYDLLEPLNGSIQSERAIEPIFYLIEKYPHADLGTPGPLVHFLEKLVGKYEQPLYRSLERRPTPLAVWMLNRIINAEKDSNQKNRLMDIMAGLLSNAQIDSVTEEWVQEFLEFQNKRG